jgi:hypothetical protein
MLEYLVERDLAELPDPGIAIRPRLATAFAMNKGAAALSPGDMPFLLEYIERPPQRAATDAELGRERTLGRDPVADTHGIVGDQLLQPGQRLIKGLHGSQYAIISPVLKCSLGTNGGTGNLGNQTCRPHVSWGVGQNSKIDM